MSKNKYQEALEEIKRITYVPDNGIDQDNIGYWHYEQIEVLQELVDNVTPKKPTLWGDGYDDRGQLIYDMYDCPNCDKSYEVDYEKYDCCPNCGQKLDWSDTDE